MKKITLLCFFLLSVCMGSIVSAQSLDTMIRKRNTSILGVFNSDPDEIGDFVAYNNSGSKVYSFVPSDAPYGFSEFYLFVTPVTNKIYQVRSICTNRILFDIVKENSQQWLLKEGCQLSFTNDPNVRVWECPNLSGPQRKALLMAPDDSKIFLEIIAPTILETVNGEAAKDFFFRDEDR